MSRRQNDRIEERMRRIQAERLQRDLQRRDQMREKERDGYLPDRG